MIMLLFLLYLYASNITVLDFDENASYLDPFNAKIWDFDEKNRVYLKYEYGRLFYENKSNRFYINYTYTSDKCALMIKYPFKTLLLKNCHDCAIILETTAPTFIYENCSGSVHFIYRNIEDYEKDYEKYILAFFLIFLLHLIHPVGIDKILKYIFNK